MYHYVVCVPLFGFVYVKLINILSKYFVYLCLPSYHKLPNKR